MAKLTRQRSGQAPATIGMMSNETALGALAMALLVFQGQPGMCCFCRFAGALAAAVNVDPAELLTASKDLGDPCICCDVDRRHGAVADAAVLQDAGGHTLFGLCRCHLYGGHQTGHLPGRPDAAVPVSVRGRAQVPPRSSAACSSQHAGSSADTPAANTPGRRRSAKERTIGWRKEFTNQFADILSHSLPMALPAALFVMQQVCGQSAAACAAHD